MKQDDELANNDQERGDFSPEIDDPMLREAMQNFRGSVHAWSDAAYHRARPATLSMAHKVAWRRMVAWTLGLVLTAGMAGTGIYEHHHRQVLAQRAHELEVQRQKALAVKRAEEDAQKEDAQKVEDLLARVDSDVSREVPAAMDPLAQLMTDDGAR